MWQRWGGKLVKILHAYLNCKNTQNKVDTVSENIIILSSQCGNSSVGRAIPCQGIGREFEPLFPLQIQGKASCFPLFISVQVLAVGCVSKSVMPRIANPVSPVRLWDAPPNIRPGGEIGRHNGLKIRRLEKGVPVRFRFWAPKILINTAIYPVLSLPDITGYYSKFLLCFTCNCDKSVTNVTCRAHFTPPFIRHKQPPTRYYKNKFAIFFIV